MSKESASSISQKTCELCSGKPSRYCCPRCKVLYCSLDCYRSDKHSECSESFYRDCVNEELASYQNDDESKKQMIEILKRMQDEDINEESIDELIENAGDVDSDDDEGVELDERLNGLNLNDADAVWEALTEDERNEFSALINQGDVGSIMPQWEPWWMYSKEKKLVEDVLDTNDKIEEEMLKKCPALRNIPDISLLTKAEPSPVIPYNIVNVLASYAFTVRYFNGEIDPVEATICLLNICANLDANSNFADLALAVESVAQKCLQSEFIETDDASLKVMKRDTFLLLQGPSEENQKYYCKAALSDLCQILFNAKSYVKKPKESRKGTSGFSKMFPEHNVENLPTLDLSKLKKCIKKVEYYLSYVQTCTMYFD